MTDLGLRKLKYSKNTIELTCSNQDCIYLLAVLGQA